MALLCTQHTHANPHTHTHIYVGSHTPVTGTYKVWNDDDYGGGCCCCCVCVLYVYLILYILSYWFKLFQRASTAFFFMRFSDFYFTFISLPCDEPSVCATEREPQLKLKLSNPRAARSQDKDIFLLNEWVNEKAC